MIRVITGKAEYKGWELPKGTVIHTAENPLIGTPEFHYKAEQDVVLKEVVISCGVSRSGKFIQGSWGAHFITDSDETPAMLWYYELPQKLYEVFAKSTLGFPLDYEEARKHGTEVTYKGGIK